MTRKELIEHYQTKLENPKLTYQSRQIAMATLGELTYLEELEQEHQDLQARTREDWF